MPTLSSLSQVTLPSGSVYEFKDAVARQMIADITGTASGAIHYVDSTTTPITDGASTSPIKVPGPNGTEVDYTPQGGDVVVYGDAEFIWSSSSDTWREFGSTGSMKALAFKDSATGTFTPAGTVTQPTFTGTAGNINLTGTPAGTIAMAIGQGVANYTPEGTVSTPTFTGTGANINLTGTPAGSVAIGVGNGTANYTPEGTVAVTPTVTPATGSVTPIDSVGTLPALEFVVTGENLEINWAAGTLPTAGTPVDVVTGIESATATATFTGTGVDLEGTFSGSEMSVTGSYTPEGTVSTPTFTGTGVDLEPTFTGSELSVSGTFTPEGTVSQPTFTGTPGNVEVS